MAARPSLRGLQEWRTFQRGDVGATPTPEAIWAIMTVSVAFYIKDEK